MTMPDRMVRARQHLQHAAGDAVLPLDGLIGVGVGAERDHRRAVFRRRQLLLQQRRGVLLDEQLALEVEPRRQAEIGVGRARVAIGAAVFAAAIGIDRAVERDVGRLVAGDDRARPLERHLGRAAARPRRAPSRRHRRRAAGVRTARWRSTARRGRAARRARQAVGEFDVRVRAPRSRAGRGPKLAKRRRASRRSRTKRERSR